MLSRIIAVALSFIFGLVWVAASTAWLGFLAGMILLAIHRAK